MGCVRVVGSLVRALVGAGGLDLIVGPWVRASKCLVDPCVRASEKNHLRVGGSILLVGPWVGSWVQKIHVGPKEHVLRV